MFGSVQSATKLCKNGAVNYLDYTEVYLQFFGPRFSSLRIFSGAIFRIFFVLKFSGCRIFEGAYSRLDFFCEEFAALQLFAPKFSG